jgi:hypothetical protein
MFDRTMLKSIFRRSCLTCALPLALLAAGCGGDNLFAVAVEDGITPPGASSSRDSAEATGSDESRR